VCEERRGQRIPLARLCRVVVVADTTPRQSRRGIANFSRTHQGFKGRRVKCGVRDAECEEVQNVHFHKIGGCEAASCKERVSERMGQTPKNLGETSENTGRKSGIFETNPQFSRVSSSSFVLCFLLGCTFQSRSLLAPANQSARIRQGDEQANLRGLLQAATGYRT
jgi:hypothetical protein